jgi:hypothetical protein
MIDVGFLSQSPGWRWSYSRLQQFHSCKYGWLLKYVFEVPQRKLFFSEYGKLIHELIAGALSGGLSWRAAEMEYIRRLHGVLQHHGPPSSIKAGYFMDGLRYLQGSAYAGTTEGSGAPLAGLRPLAIEQYVEFDVGVNAKASWENAPTGRILAHPFCGYIDLIARDTAGAISVIDHKSRALKERSPRRVKSNAVLDEYLRQLYLYSIPVVARYGPPDNLMFNCFRTGTLISEPFSRTAFDETVAWALRTIEEILRETDWLPCENAWKCRYLCDVAGECEYYA